MDGDEELANGRVGQTVGGRWRLDRVLGVGGMAAVYEARDALGSVVALKLLHPEMAVKRDVRERFLREGYVANHLGHPGVVRALEHGDGGADGVFLAMELLIGETLAARVKRHGRLPLEELVEYTDQILEVLIVAHDKGVVHRDLKPDNLFVTAEGRIKILDFGLARLLDGIPGDHKTRTGLALGTLPYMAPEQALGRRNEIDGRVDVFALGATMFRILSGRKVHEAHSEAELLMAMASRPAPPLKSVAPETPDGLCVVIDLALAFSRDARYPNARTMLADLRAVRAGRAPEYASSRFSAREEATRADRVAPSVARPPAEMSPVSQRATVPLSAYGGSPALLETMGSAIRTTLPQGTPSPVRATLPQPTPPALGATLPPGTAPAFGATLPPGSVAAAPLSLPGANAPYPAPANTYLGAPPAPPPVSHAYGPGFNSAVPTTSSMVGQTPPPPRSRKAPVLAAIAGLFLLAGAAAAAFWFLRTPSADTLEGASAATSAEGVAAPNVAAGAATSAVGEARTEASPAAAQATSTAGAAVAIAGAARAATPEKKVEGESSDAAAAALAPSAPASAGEAAAASDAPEPAPSAAPSPEPAPAAAPAAASAAPPAPPAPAAPKAAPPPAPKPTPQSPSKKGKSKKSKNLGL